jgi:butyrate kinase
MYTIFVINPGSTSTKIALFQEEKLTFADTISHAAVELANFPTIVSQFDLRYYAISQFLEKNHIQLTDIDAFVGRGGLLRPVSSGTFLVDEKMLQDLRSAAYGDHASNLGALLAHALAQQVDKPAYIVDPVVVDELDDLARFSGHPELARRSIFHALNHKAVARKAAALLNKKYTDVNLIIAHLGGGISVASHLKGRVIDVNNALDGDGPFTPERSGSLPVGDLARLCFSGKYDKATVAKMIKGKGGIVAYLGTNDMRLVEERIKSGDKKAETVYRAMAYQVSKEITAQGAVLKGDIDAIVITGGIAFDGQFVSWIKERCSYMAPVLIFPGEAEMDALALGALRVLNKTEEAKKYGDA